MSEVAEQAIAEVPADQAAVEQPVDQVAGQGEQQAEVSQGSESYAEFSLPEGLRIDEAAFGEFSPLAKEFGLTQEQAQKLVDVAAGLVDRTTKTAEGVHADTIKKWADDSRNDAEVGGKDFDANLGIALAAIDKFGDDELKQILDASGFGNHPAVVRLFYRVGKAASNDGFVVGNAAQNKEGMYAYMNEGKK
jgi:hypothetical protein